MRTVAHLLGIVLQPLLPLQADICPHQPVSDNSGEEHGVVTCRDVQT